jgi:hypothetical protein
VTEQQLGRVRTVTVHNADGTTSQTKLRTIGIVKHSLAINVSAGTASAGPSSADVASQGATTPETESGQPTVDVDPASPVPESPAADATP